MTSDWIITVVVISHSSQLTLFTPTQKHLHCSQVNYLSRYLPCSQRAGWLLHLLSTLCWIGKTPHEQVEAINFVPEYEDKRVVHPECLWDWFRLETHWCHGCCLSTALCDLNGQEVKYCVTLQDIRGQEKNLQYWGAKKKKEKKTQTNQKNNFTKILVLLVHCL